MFREKSSSPSYSQWTMFFTCFAALLLSCSTQSQRKTDEKETLALNTIFSRWNISAPRLAWNISGDPCTGVATNSTSLSGNPSIKCDDDCNDSNETTICHITQIRVYGLDVTGPIPDELQSFPQLSHLDLRYNHLTGSLPAFLGSFSNMQYMYFYNNTLSGAIPKELGNLTKLISLRLNSNTFNGSLPQELGSLTNLQHLGLRSNNFNGSLPQELGSLTNLQEFWASGKNFTGTIPDFIGDLTNLTELKLQGNSFQGPIPSSMAKLTKLRDLRIGDLTDGTSSLAFIQNMTNLDTLVLRNCKISGLIPSKFWRYTSLQRLDLSFNSLSGQLPQSLFNLHALTHLLLGNNSLSGSLPVGKAAKLAYIDLSYNNLSGSFPNWVISEIIGNLNLVANNFVLDDSDNSTLFSGLHCLQKDNPCYRGSPKWSSFAINCGGSKNITSSDGTLYEPDYGRSYYLSKSKKWATSNVGIYLDSSYGSSQSNSSPITNTNDSELFQSAMISPSSLRYFGIGLENGNYNVKLQFAETAFPDYDLPSLTSTRKRIFDIYIQGNLVANDFDIREEAGGASFRAIARNYFANVTENFLEIHFFWAGKGTCCEQATYGPLVSAISVTPNFIPTIGN